MSAPGLEAEQQLRARAAVAHSLHDAKVRSLMTSLSRLEKENYKLKHASREHRRVERFKRCQDELGKQDAIICRLETRLDQAAVKEIFDRVQSIHAEQLPQPKTREELTLECEQIARQVANTNKVIASLQRELRLQDERLRTQSDPEDVRTVARELEASAEEADQQAEQLMEVQASLRSQKAALERSLAQQEEVAIQTQDDSISRRPSYLQQVGIVAGLRARVPARQSEVMRTRELLRHLQGRLEELETSAGQIMQEEAAAQRTSQSLYAEANDVVRDRQPGQWARIHEESAEVARQGQQLERKRTETRRQTEEWRAGMRHWDAEMSAAQQELREREEQTEQRWHVRTEEQLVPLRAAQQRDEEEELSALRAADRKLEAASEVSDRALSQAIDLDMLLKQEKSQEEAAAEKLALERAQRLRDDGDWLRAPADAEARKLERQLEVLEGEIGSAKLSEQQSAERQEAAEARRSAGEELVKLMKQLQEVEAALDSAVVAKAQDLKGLLREIARLEDEARGRPAPQDLSSSEIAQLQPDSPRLPWPVDILLAGVRAASRRPRAALEEEKHEEEEEAPRVPRSRYLPLRKRLEELQRALRQEQSHADSIQATRQHLEEYHARLEEDVRQLQMQLAAARVFIRRTGGAGGGSQSAEGVCPNCGLAP